MAIESVGYTPGSGRDIAVDTIGGLDFQVQKASYGADGVISLVEDTAALPVRFGFTTTPRLNSSQISAALSGQNTVLSGTAAQTIRVWKFFLMNTDPVNSVNLKWRSGTNDFHPAFPIGPLSSWVLDFDSEPWFVTNAAEDLILNLSGAIQISGRFYYTKS